MLFSNDDGGAGGDDDCGAGGNGDGSGDPMVAM